MNPITQAFLIPVAPKAPTVPPAPAIEPVVLTRLHAVASGSPLHLALVEIVRRRYIAFHKEIDRQDKERIRAIQSW